MYTISNRHMQLIVRYVTMFREGARPSQSIRDFNDHRMAGLLLRALARKKPLK